MAVELKLIAIYLAVSDACRDIVGDGRLRRRGFAPALTDAEVITMEIFAEMQGHHSDSAIWRYFDAHWRQFFPTLPTRSVFAKHGANLSMLKQMVQRVLYPAAADIHLTDGFPISVCTRCWTRSATTSPLITGYIVKRRMRSLFPRGENDGDGTSLFFTMPRTVGTHLPHWGTQPRWRNTPAGDEIPVSIATETCFSVKALQMQTYTVPSPGRFFFIEPLVRNGRG